MREPVAGNGAAAAGLLTLRPLLPAGAAWADRSQAGAVVVA